VAYDVPQERERKYVKKRVRGLLLIVVAGVLGGVATVLTVFGQPLGETFSDSLPFGGGVFVAVWTVVRWLLAIGAIAVLFAAFYYLGPNRESPRWSWLSPGGVVGALIWLLSSLGFSFYVSSVGSYTKNYGSFAGVVVLLLWLYLSAIAVMLGGELNAELERQSALRTGEVQEPPDEGGVGPSTAEAPGARPVPSRAEPSPASEQTAGTSEWTKRMEELRRGR
jgi:membrane protein